MDRILIVLAWAALVAWAVRPVPDRGIPVGRAGRRVYLGFRQAMGLGAVLLAIAVVLIGTLGHRDTDITLVGLCLAWLGGLLIVHGRRGARSG